MNDNSIDYGRGIINIDLKTGIRYGVINQNKVMYWAEESKPYYDPNLTEEELDMAEPWSWFISNDEYQAESDSYGDIFITKSPYYTLCALCSPCAPGAGDLTAEGNKKAYCFGHDWFDDGKAPYKVYDVKTGKEVLP